MSIKIMKLYLFLCFVSFNGVALGKIFNVMDFGAIADGRTDNTKAFEQTWNVACGSSGSATILVPKGTYWLGPVKFTGPCKNVPDITMKMEGHLMAETNVHKYPTGDWVYFGWITGLTITGSGTFDGQGQAIWHMNDCYKNQQCRLLPTNVKFHSMTNTVIDGITSLNSKNFHFGIIESNNFKVKNIRILAPADSPNTDGMHVERCSDVTIQDATIGTGDDCISLGQGLSNVLISGIKCGPGHGISIGSLGKYLDEEDVRGVIIRDIIFSGTSNGVRIKSWPKSPSASAVSKITYDNIIMNNVDNPIIIDQLYCPQGSCLMESPSRVKIRDVTFNNIRGTSSSEVAVKLHCSQAYPCKNVKLNDINIRNINKGSQVKSLCLNIKAWYSGTQVPPPCPR